MIVQRIIFMGTPEYASSILKKLLKADDIKVVAVFTQPDKPVGRKKIMTPPIVKTIALENSINVYQPVRLRDIENIEIIFGIECDFIVVAAYGQILPKEVLNYAPCINLHASILPKYRGASPIQQTILNGDRQTGVTAMLMDVGLDTGDILKIKTINVDANEMLNSLFERLTRVASELTLDILKNFDLYKPQKQNDTLSTHCKKITKKDGEVDFVDALELFNKYRAFTPWPGIYTQNGLKLKSIELVESTSSNKILEILDIEKNSIVVGCKKGSIRIFRVQPVSKKEMDILSYINGKRFCIADTLS